MWWYLADLARFKSERVGVDALAANAGWLEPVASGWRTDESKKLIFDADIVIGTRTFSIYLSFPENFPHTPASIFPRGETSRWSDHQFGPGGELCLEYGPDNWTSDMTGAQLLESAHRLLATENPPEGDREEVPSRHEVSLGQRLRSTVSRLLVTRKLEEFFARVESGTKLKANMLVLYRVASSVYVIDKVTLPDGTVWQNTDVPTTLGYETYERTIGLLRIASTQALPPISSAEAFKDAALALGFEAEETTVVVLKGNRTYGFQTIGQSVLPMTAIPVEPEVQRLDEAHAALREISVAIIGCGSMGSKIAAMLARAGVSDFYLIDDDLLLPDNLVRNDLDWRDVGTHKTTAVTQRIYDVNPGATVYSRQVRLAGKESSGSADAALSSLVRRDLFIDATANANVFNLVAAVAESVGRPMVWAEVYGGGFGGFIARYRPGIEPPPQLMRRAVENWFADRNYKSTPMTRDYATGGDGPVLIADDADVTSIAAPAARLIIDTLLSRSPSHFPYAAYVIGLAPEEGLFSQAFQTFPIDMPPAPPHEPKPELTPEESAAEIEEIVKIFSAK